MTASPVADGDDGERDSNQMMFLKLFLPSAATKPMVPPSTAAGNDASIRSQILSSEKDPPANSE